MRNGPLLPHPVSGRRFPSPVPPGSGWPGDPAEAGARPATTAADVVAGGRSASGLRELDAAVSVCRACPRLVAWRETVAIEKRRSFAGEPYWGRPIAGWGSERPRVLVVGLAPAANGGNRTGRIFTGDRSGDWLFASLHRVGLATQETSVHAGDGQRLVDTRMVAAVRCAPPGNAPTTAERDTCAPWLDAELRLVLPWTRTVVCLGLFAWQVMVRAAGRQGYRVPRPQPRFGHGVRLELSRPVAEPSPGDPPADDLLLLGCYHPSQQNTFTGRLTEPMLDAVLGEAARRARP
jgi:uracil-DNA glycosylase